MFARFGEMVDLSDVMMAAISASVARATGEAIARPKKERTRRIATEAILMKRIWAYIEVGLNRWMRAVMDALI
jgi:hypothetical protein